MVRKVTVYCMSIVNQIYQICLSIFILIQVVSVNSSLDIHKAKPLVPGLKAPGEAMGAFCTLSEMPQKDLKQELP